jgi:ATP-dependent DNA helicase RecQ
LSDLKRLFPNVPVLALTATATPEVTRDIVDQLGMRAPHIFRGSFLRSNLHVSAIPKSDLPGSTRDAIASLVAARRGQSGIVYCLSRKSTEAAAEHLSNLRQSAAYYHAGMSSADRTRVQDGFRNGDIDVVVATIAFGMGIDKPDVRFVLHHDLPRSIEGYYQEIGRAGRDGLASECVLFYSWSDVKAYERIAALQDDEEAGARLLAQARQTFRLVEAEGCRHQNLVGYFDERIDACGSSCDRCAKLDAHVVVRRRPRKAEAAGSAAPWKGTAEKPSEARGATPSADDSELFARLRRERRLIAEELKVPAYVVFTDATLLEMASRKPQSEAELLTVSGVGLRKLERYGERFLALLRS